MTNLAKNMLNNRGLAFLTTPDEKKELSVTGIKILSPESIAAQNRTYPKGTVKLKRTFTMLGFKFWRVIAPDYHANYQSDLSLEGLKEWGII